MLTNPTIPAEEPQPQARCEYILSFGGGVNTFALMLLIQQLSMPLHHVVFADTGGETPETYDAIDYAESFYQNLGIPFHRLAQRPKGTDLYHTAIRRRVTPSIKWRWCTRDFKVNPIHRFYRSLDYPVHQYIGIAADEIHRIRHDSHPNIRNVYPLVDLGVSRQGCIDIIRQAGLPVPPKSGCYFCPFNSAPRWQLINSQHPELFESAIRLEENSKHFPTQRLTDQAFRNQESITLRSYRNLITAGSHIETIPEGSDCGGYCMT